MKLRTLLMILAILGGIPHLKASEYPFMSIPAPLLKNSNAVIRLEDRVVEVHSPGRITLRNTRVITVLNEAGDDFAMMYAYYSRTVTLDNFEGTLFDAMGKKIRSLKKTEIKDQNISEAGQMIDDTRIKYHSFYHKTYPYTVAYVTEYTFNRGLTIPGWSPVPARNLSVMESRYTLVTNKDYQVRIKESNIPSAAEVTEAGSKKIMKWTLLAQPAMKTEYASPPLSEITPTLKIAPTDFKIEEYNGSLRSWDELGSFFSKLNAGRDELPESTRQKVRELTDGLKTDEEKITRLYRFLQETTHYIGVQIGIGGLQPFPAKYVVENGYGDCKALSNYMVALLKAAGIRSHYTLIYAGNDPGDTDPDFPQDNFNHIVVAVPGQKDTTWLECTSQTQSPGYMGSFTGNRYALMITETGGKLVRTPHYKKELNTISSRIKAEISQEGRLEADVTNLYTALTTDDLHGRIHHLSKEDQLKYLRRAIDLPNYDVTSFNYTEKSSKLPSIKEELRLVAADYAQFTGKRLFLTPNIINRWSHKLNSDSARKYSLELTAERIEVDTVEITIPEGYTIERQPRPEDIKTVFGSYRSSLHFSGNRILYTRRLELNRGKFSAAQYKELVEFYENLYKADHSRLVLVKPAS